MLSVGIVSYVKSNCLELPCWHCIRGVCVYVGVGAERQERSGGVPSSVCQLLMYDRA